jgi:NADH-quinone oxidoreductase subunit L
LWSVLIALATALFPLLLIPFALSGGELVIHRSLVLGLDFTIIIDSLAILMSIVSSSIGALIVIYSIGYVSHDDAQNEYYLMVLLFIGAMMGLVFSANLIFMYLFWEITAICCWRLIGFYRLKEHIIKADKAFLVTFFGAVVMLLGFILIYSQTKTFDLTLMRGVAVPGMAVFLILIGMFSKSASVPLHTWLPDAGVAPSTVTSLLHAAVLVKIGVYAYARLFCYTFQLPAGWLQAIPWILAYSTVSQLGYIFLGLSCNNQLGVSGGLAFLLMHGLAKAGLFLCAGIVEHTAHKRDIRELGGLIKTMPLTAASFIFCAFSVIGIPPFGGFFSKLMVIMGTVDAHKIPIAALALFTAVMTMFYLFRLFHAIFMGEPKPSIGNNKEGTVSMLFVVVVLAVLSLLAGIFIAYPMKIVSIATVQILRWVQ